MSEVLAPGAEAPTIIEKPMPHGSLPAEGYASPSAQASVDAKKPADDEAGKEDKPQKSAHELRIEELERDKIRMQRGIDRRTRQLAEERASRQLTQPAKPADNEPASDGDTVQLTKAELAQRIREEAERLAPSMREKAAEVERRQGVIQSLEKTFGSQKFDQIASDLDDAFGGLADRSGTPRPAVEAVFEADNPAQVIEYLANPDNSDEAEAIARMSASQAGKTIARLEDKLKATAAAAKPKPSAAAAPLEPIRGEGRTSNGAPDPSNVKAWTRWANAQEAKQS